MAINTRRLGSSTKYTPDFCKFFGGDSWVCAYFKWMLAIVVDDDDDEYDFYIFFLVTVEGIACFAFVPCTN